MGMKLVHAAAALLTVILYIVRQRYITARLCPVKSRNATVFPCSYGVTPFTTIPLLPDNLYVCARAACFYEGCQPKYKRDPDISIDNENIGQQPHD